MKIKRLIKTEVEVEIKFPCYTFQYTGDGRRFAIYKVTSEKDAIQIGVMPNHNIGEISKSCVDNAFSDNFNFATELDWLEALDESIALIKRCR